jgi:predicted dienelactone hydrolase
MTMTTVHWCIASVIIMTAWAAGASAPGPAVPMPDGEHAVGVIPVEFVDPSRPLDAADRGSGPRLLPAIVWYPADGPADGPAGGPADHPAYLDGGAASVTLPAIARNFRFEVEELHPLAVVRMHVRSGAPAARRPRGFPVVLFSHGFFLYPEQNSALASRLASHGYIVVSIAHPGDAADRRLEDGRIIATKIGTDGDDPRFAEAFRILVGGAGLETSRTALSDYSDSLPATRIGRSFADWREDTLAVARAIVEGDEPRALRDVLVAADRSRLAFAGMSFGGSTAATTCRLVDACRAVVNLDGQNFDPELFDRPVARPLLLMLSDWTRYGLFEGQPRDADFSPNDLAYERWSAAGEDRDVVRVRLEGIRHMGFTDLVALLEGPKREERVGEIGGDEALAAIGDLVLAFLDAHLADGNARGVERAIERHRALRRHVPARLKEWVGQEVGLQPGARSATVHSR